MARNGDIKMKWLKTKRTFARAVHVVQNQACRDTSFTPSTMRLRNLKAQLYLYGLAYRPHGTFRKRSSNWRNLRTATRFRVEGKHFETEAFQERRLHDNHVISLPEFSSNKSKMTGDCCVFKFLRRSVDRTHLMGFQN